MLKSLYRYGGVNSYDLLKAVAIITMIIDHIGYFFYQDIHFLRVIGRLSYPLFAFCVGYNQKYRFDMDLFILAVLACFSNIILYPELKFMIRDSILKSSILPSIIIIRLAMNYFKRFLTAKNLYLCTFILWCLAFKANYLFQYGTLGIIIAICGYLCAIKSAEYKVFLYVNLILYLLFQAALFRVNGFELAVLFIAFSFIARYLKTFSILPINISGPVSTILLFLSRYSLVIYFVHSLIFKLIYSL